MALSMILMTTLVKGNKCGVRNPTFESYICKRQDDKTMQIKHGKESMHGR